MAKDPPRRQGALQDDMAATAFVQASQLCRNMPEEELTRLVASATLLHCDPDCLLIEAGDSDDALYLVIEGAVGLFKQRGDEAIEIAVLERAAVFGETAVLTESVHDASALTRTECLLIRFPGDVVRAVADAAPKFGRRLASLMAGRSKEAEKKLS